MTAVKYEQDFYAWAMQTALALSGLVPGPA